MAQILWFVVNSTLGILVQCVESVLTLLESLLPNCEFLLHYIKTLNVGDFSAKMLAGQYSQLQPFYRNKHLLIAIGDDFFFSEPRDFTENYRNYRLLIEHINSNPQFKMNIKFSTVSEYFKGLRSNNQNHEYPILRGDFFPYTENREGSHPYWTGYFVHRPNFKRLERIIQGKLRRLDISRVLLGRIDNYDMLQIHRRNLALVQHRKYFGFESSNKNVQ